MSAVGERLYEGLLRLYPRPFRQRYGAEMVQLFGDQLRDARGGQRPGAIAMTWFRALGDLIGNAVAERARDETGIGQSLGGPPLPVLRALGLIGVLGGLVLLVVFVVDELAPALNFARLALFGLGAVAIVLGIRATGLARTSRAVSAATIAAGLANAAFVAITVLSVDRPQFPEPDQDFRLIAFYVYLAMWLADAALGLALLRLRGIGRLGALALAIGSPIGALGMDRFGLIHDPTFGEVIQTAALWGIALNGLGWILVGASLVLARPVEPAAAGSDARA
jgi:hypothetical protein